MKRDYTDDSLNLSYSDRDLNEPDASRQPTQLKACGTVRAQFVGPCWCRECQTKAALDVLRKAKLL